MIIKNYFTVLLILSINYSIIPTARGSDNYSQTKNNIIKRRRLDERNLRTELNLLHRNKNIVSSTSTSSIAHKLPNYPSPPITRSVHSNSILSFNSSVLRRDDKKSICYNIPGLTREQMELCLKLPEVTRIALSGIELGVSECAFQMSKNRWNCSSLQGTRNPYSTTLLQKGYRESAFGHAISSAGVAFAIAKACSQGKLLSCGCGFQYDEQINYYPTTEAEYIWNDNSDSTLQRGITNTIQTNRPSWKWSGCSHNMGYGLKFAKKFLDSREKSSDLPSRINLHNNRVGRLAVSSNMEIRCKCHGLSGSCELRTCWKSAPEFRNVGTALKAKFRKAVMIDQTGFGNRPVLLNSRARSESNKLHRRRRRDRQLQQNREANIDLWYYERSPTYCESNPDFDFPGTSGRKCNRTENPRDPGSCSTLCCGRGYNTIRQVYSTRCNCTFKWCCEVICQNCTVDEWITVCK